VTKIKPVLIDGGLPNPLFVTGSSSFHLRAATRESLASRASRHTLHPFSLAEVGAADSVRPPLIHARALRQAVVGSYPDVWFSEDPRGDLGAFRTLLGLLAGQTATWSTQPNGPTSATFPAAPS
jgi:predicted AAA+ superfamily ATPase